MNKGLYIHFPFCERKCHYCDFYSVVNSTKAAEYTDALCREIEKQSDPRIKTDTVYFGGGTPSLMDAASLCKILNAVKSSFDLSENAEITLEANPMSVKETEKLTAFRKAGINRLSLGVQSFNDTELEALGRAHSAELAVNTVKEAKRAGFDNISLDLMFAIPHQTADSFKRTLETATSLDVQHVSVYALSVEEKTVFGVKQKRGEDLFLPGEDLEYEMYFSASKTLGDAGFEHYEISNFAKDGKRSRHNMKYWKGEEYLGIGAGAHSYFNGERYSTPADITAFCKNAEKQDSYKNTPLDRAEEAVFLSLRLKDGLNIERLEKEHGVTKTPDFEQTVDELTSQGFCRYDGRTLALTEKGFFVSNSVIVKILDKLEI